jgi:hypothetical protein
MLHRASEATQDRALIRISVRRIHLLLASGYPDQDLFRRIYLRLQDTPLPV